MNYNEHSLYKDKHAFLSPSKYHWINYSDDKLISSYNNFSATEKGTELHNIACLLIENGIKLPRSKKTLNMYVNDAIGFGLIPEVTLLYSDNCFGRVDAISSIDSVIKTKKLRIHDYKSGTIPAHMEQLEVYAALFCLEYKFAPAELDMELCIYQSDDVISCKPEHEDIVLIIDKIKHFDKILSEIKSERGIIYHV